MSCIPPLGTQVFWMFGDTYSMWQLNKHGMLQWGSSLMSQHQVHDHLVRWESCSAYKAILYLMLGYAIACPMHIPTDVCDAAGLHNNSSVLNCVQCSANAQAGWGCLRLACNTCDCIGAASSLASIACSSKACVRHLDIGHTSCLHS